MAIDDRVQSMLTEISSYRRELRSRSGDGDGKGAGDDGSGSGMESRVTRLEAHMEHLQEDVREVKADLKTLITAVSSLPTRADLNSWRWQWLGMGVAIIALTVGGITGGLALIARFAS